MSTKRKRIPIYMQYAAVILALAFGVLLFGLLYKGGGALVLLDGEVPASAAPADGADSNATDPSGTASPDSTPDGTTAGATVGAAASPAPDSADTVHVTLSGRLIPYLADNGMWGYKNTSGEVAVKAIYTKAAEFDGDIAFAAQNGLYGLITRTGNWLVEPVWTDFLPFSEDKAAVENGEKWGYIDRDGNIVIDYLYREAGSFHCGRAMARSASEYGFIDIYGNVAVAFNWKTVTDFSDDVAFARSSSDNSYIINKVGEKIANLSSKQYGSPYSCGYALIQEGSERYFFNSSARTAFKTTYADALPFSGDLAAVFTDGAWGYIDTKGVLTIPATFASALSFSNGAAAVKDATTGLWGYISTNGTFIIEPKYDSAEAFIDGYALVSVNGEHKLVDKKGEEVFLYFSLA